jgi:hypothetical protein
MAAKSISLVELSLKGVASPIDSNWDTRAFKCESIMEWKLSEVALKNSPVMRTHLKGKSNCVDGEEREPNWDTMGTVSSKLGKASSSPKGVLAKMGKGEALRVGGR